MGNLIRADGEGLNLVLYSCFDLEDGTGQNKLLQSLLSKKEFRCQKVEWLIRSGS